jgi:hypothetical protein
MKSEIIDKRIIDGAYGMDHTQVIVDHKKLGRILIVDWFGEEDEVGGSAYRLRFGRVALLKPDDTFASLDKDWNDWTSTIDAVLHGHDLDRPLQAWDGLVVNNLARSIGL